ncbi:MAG: hypothetical protein KGK30_02105 [Elusimicrobia bacterium]|nr:hypothetical protein [Elusimicrobiota bacterium]
MLAAAALLPAVALLPAAAWAARIRPLGLPAAIPPGLSGACRSTVSGVRAAAKLDALRAITRVSMAANSPPSLEALAGQEPMPDAAFFEALPRDILARPWLLEDAQLRQAAVRIYDPDNVAVLEAAALRIRRDRRYEQGLARLRTRSRHVNERQALVSLERMRRAFAIAQRVDEREGLAPELELPELRAQAAARWRLVADPVVDSAVASLKKAARRPGGLENFTPEGRGSPKQAALSLLADPTLLDLEPIRAEALLAFGPKNLDAIEDLASRLRDGRHAEVLQLLRREHGRTALSLLAALGSLRRYHEATSTEK